MVRLKKITFIVVITLVVLFIYFKIPVENKDLLRLNEINERINEIEKLIQTNRKNFELIKNALLETHLNTETFKELKNLKAILNLLQSQSKINESSNNLKWNNNFYKICPIVNFSKPDIDMTKLYDLLDFTDKDGGVWKQGFKIEYKMEDVKQVKLKVFVVPHSHQDPGWIKTVDDYFKEDTQLILNSMLDFLTKEPNMKFIYAEVVFFEKWWNSINKNQKDQVKKLIKNKQLEIVTGGWVMTDEANTHYSSIINQLSDGHLWLKNNLNYTPISGWAIDPFGYSQFMPYLLKKSGINNMVIQRVHYVIKKRLASLKQLEFRWKQFWDSEDKYIINCHMMPFFSYDIPHTCGPDPSICCQYDFIRILNFRCPWGKDPIEITDENVKMRAEILLDQYRKKAQLYDNGNNLLVPLGDDFRFKSEKEWSIQYRNYKKLMDYINKQKEWNVEIKFGILSDYFDSLKKDKVNMFPTLSGDMFSYADREDHYWTGYFTTRPFLKILDRILMTHLRTAEIVLSLSLIYHNKYNYGLSTVFNQSLLHEKIDVSRKTLSLFQHHDGVAGTCKSHVAADYKNQLLNAIKISQFVFTYSAQRILQNNVGISQFDQIIFDVDNLKSYSGKFNKNNFIQIQSRGERYVYLFNSLSQPRQLLVHIPIEVDTETIGIKIMGSGNQIIKCQLNPIVQLAEFNNNQHFVSFKLNIGPLAFERVRILSTSMSETYCSSVHIHVYNIKNSITFKKNFKVSLENSLLNKYIVLKNSLKKLHINSTTGYIELVEDLYSKSKYKLKISFKKYGARNSRETSGAYLFIPDGEGSEIEFDSMNTIFHFQGELYDEVFVENKLFAFILKFFKIDGLLSNAIDIENIVDIRKESNYEISMVIKTDFVVPSDEFFVDSNCFQFIRRKNSDKIPIQGNVYPMTCGIYIESKIIESTHRVSLFSKQSNGVRVGKILFQGSTLNFIEVFLDRILNQDDNRGLYESLIDNEVVSKSYRLLFEDWKQVKNDNSEFGEFTISGYQLMNDLIYPVHQMVVKANFTNSVPTNLVGQKSLLTGYGLPCDYHLINFKTNINEIPKLTIHRLKLNCYAGYVSEGSCKFVQKKSPLLKSMFDDVSIKYVNKLYLSGNQVNEDKMKPENIRMNLMDIDTYAVHFDN